MANMQGKSIIVQQSNDSSLDALILMRQNVHFRNEKALKNSFVVVSGKFTGIIDFKLASFFKVAPWNNFRNEIYSFHIS